jgi:hypothetical protein
LASPGTRLIDVAMITATSGNDSHACRSKCRVAASKLSSSTTPASEPLPAPVTLHAPICGQDEQIAAGTGRGGTTEPAAEDACAAVMRALVGNVPAHDDIAILMLSRRPGTPAP